MENSNFYRKMIKFAATIALFAAFQASYCVAQRPRFPDFFQTTPTTAVPAQVAPVQGNVFPGFATQSGQVVPPPASIVAPVFDPFRSNSQALPFNPTPQSITPADTAPNIFFPPQNVQVLPPGQADLFNQGFGQQNIGPQGFGQPGQFGTGQPLFPRTGQTGQFFRRFTDDFLPRLLERPRIRHTYLPGSNGNELQIHDTEFATTLTFPRFLFSQQPVRVTPGFISHFWDGPETAGPFGTGFDLPETAFSAFLTLEHISDPNRRAGVESNFTVGIYSDYEHLDSDSLRVTGVGLGWFRLNQTNIFKFGAEYFDRVDVKILPAFGLFIRPTQDIQIDLYFPRPRIAQRLPNFRSLETWLYVAGEYGGGSWTVERAGGLDDRIDINDFRALLGIEWFGPRGVTGFVETGYVFDRELVSFSAIPARRLELEDTVMLRLGLEF